MQKLLMESPLSRGLKKTLFWGEGRSSQVNFLLFCTSPNWNFPSTTRVATGEGEEKEGEPGGVESLGVGEHAADDAAAADAETAGAEWALGHFDLASEIGPKFGVWWTFQQHWLPGHLLRWFWGHWLLWFSIDAECHACKGGLVCEPTYHQQGGSQCCGGEGCNCQRARVSPKYDHSCGHVMRVVLLQYDY